MHVYSMKLLHFFDMEIFIQAEWNLTKFHLRSTYSVDLHQCLLCGIICKQISHFKRLYYI